MYRFEFLFTKWYAYRLLFIILLIIISTLYYMEMKFVLNRDLLDLSVNRYLANNSHEGQIRCIVYTEERSGRLGNRMFIVASAYGLARLHSCHLYITPQIIDELKSMFHIIKTNTTPLMNTTAKDIVCRYLPELTRPNAIAPGTIFELQGYWQSYLHFANYADELRENIFVATQPVLVKISAFFFKLYQDNFNITPSFSFENHQSFKKQLAQSNLITWIGMHVRRSDFVKVNYSSSNEYLFSAMKYYISLYSNAYFLVATDDKSYCKNLFHNQSNVFLTPQSFSEGDDLITLSLCQHSIVTGGTFGWWTAYLAHGRVVHDKVYPSGCERREYYYPPWFMIDGNVRARHDSSYVL